MLERHAVTATSAVMHPEPANVDLAILGAGAAGMLAALSAAKRGLRACIVDPHFSRSNNLSISGGLIPIPGSRLQQMARVEDSPERWLADLRAFAAGSVNERIAAAVAHRLPRVLDFLLDRCAAPIRFLPDVPGPGHSARRFHAVQPASGSALHAWLRRAIEDESAIACIPDVPIAGVERDRQDCELRFGESASSQQARSTNRQARAPSRLRARSLLLAGGGFGANPAMVAEFIPEMTGAIYSGSPTNDGSVIALARGWGAALSGMDGYQGQGHTNPVTHTRLGMSLPTLGAVMLNRECRRFVREDVGPSGLAAHVLAQPGQVVLEVFDREIEGQLANHAAYQEARAAGRIIEAESLDELAARAGVSAPRLEEAMREVEEYARGQRFDPLGRRSFAKTLQPPFRASWVTGSLAHTQGGVVTDGDGQVLDEHGAPIAGLFAAGGCAAGLSGHGGDGYLPGNGLAQAFALAHAAVAKIAGD
jgi:fumarate reductase flavoprotein subunit